MKKVEISLEGLPTLELGHIPKSFWPSVVASHLVTRVKHKSYAIIDLKTSDVMWFDIKNEYRK